MFEEEEWRSLKDSEKEIFADAVMVKAKSNSALYDSVESLKQSSNRDSKYFLDRIMAMKEDDPNLNSNF